MAQPSPISGPVMDEGANLPSRRRVDTDLKPEPGPHRGEETVRQESVLLPLQTAPATERGFEPLLPPQEAAQADAQTAAPGPPPSEPGETILRSDAGFTLRIGRIEVRAVTETAVQSPAQRAVRSAVTRPVILPRATVRQSLDDYRASRKR